MRPLDIVNVKIVAVSGSIMPVVAVESFSDVQFLGTSGSIDAYGFQYLSASKDGMCSVLIDV
jgi:hypothetical protein